MKTHYAIAIIGKRLPINSPAVDDAKIIRDHIIRRRSVASEIQTIIDTTKIRPDDLLIIEFFRNSLNYGTAQPTDVTPASAWLRDRGLRITIPKMNQVGICR